MFTEQINNTTTVISTTDTLANRFIGLTTGAYCAANAKAIGVSMYDFDAGDSISVALSGSIKIVTTGAAVTAGDAVVSDAEGKAVPATPLSATVPGSGTTVTSSSAQPDMTIMGSETPQHINGYALDTVLAADELIRILVV